MGHLKNQYNMNTKSKKQVTKKSLMGNYLLTVIVNISQDDQFLHGFVIRTTKAFFNVECPLFVDKNEKARMEAFGLFADTVRGYNYRVSDLSLANSPILNESELSILAPNLRGLLSDYLFFSNGVSTFLKKNGSENSIITISIDVADESKTKIVGSYYDGKMVKEVNLDNQIN